MFSFCFLIKFAKFDFWEWRRRVILLHQIICFAYNQWCTLWLPSWFLGTEITIKDFIINNFTRRRYIISVLPIFLITCCTKEVVYFLILSREPLLSHLSLNPSEITIIDIMAQSSVFSAFKYKFIWLWNDIIFRIHSWQCENVRLCVFIKLELFFDRF